MAFLRMKLPKRAGKRAGRSVLAVIAGLLIASALVRLGGGAGQAVALVTDGAMNTMMQDGAEKGPEKGTAPPVGAAMAEDFPPTMGASEISDMVAAFQAREARLVAREEALEDRMAALRVADQQISEKLAKLEQAETQLRETIALAETASKDDLDRLTLVYENMKPKQASALFEEMDPNFAAGFLGRMRPEAAAAIMAGLSPESAHLFSVVLAGRNANVPQE
ncbi:MAG: hypothetical protein AAF641_04190 [Pseudomonadota bacterium]